MNARFWLNLPSLNNNRVCFAVSESFFGSLKSFWCRPMQVKCGRLMVDALSVHRKKKASALLWSPSSFRHIIAHLKWCGLLIQQVNLEVAINRIKSNQIKALSKSFERASKVDYFSINDRPNERPGTPMTGGQRPVWPHRAARLTNGKWEPKKQPQNSLKIWLHFRLKFSFEILKKFKKLISGISDLKCHYKRLIIFLFYKQFKFLF